MKYELRGISLVLTAWLALWVSFALLARWLWRVGRDRVAHWSPRDRARWLFALQIGPLLGACGGVLAVLLPAYVRHEPVGTEESLGVALLSVACFGAAILGWACWRVVQAWRRTRRLLRHWRRGAERVSVDGLAVPVWRIEHPLPLLVVVGVLRPQLFVAAHLLAHLTAEELAAVLRHEHGHVTARDNWRRGWVEFCRHGLAWLPGGRDLEQDWHESVEMAADEYAAQQHPRRALDLAAALVKIARLFPAHNAVALPATVSMVLMDDSRLARRVQRLMDLSEGQPKTLPAHVPALWPGLTGLFLLTILALAWQSDALRIVHRGIEWIVTYLP